MSPIQLNESSLGSQDSSPWVACVGVGGAGRRLAVAVAARWLDDFGVVSVGPSTPPHVERAPSHIQVSIPRGLDNTAALQLEGEAAARISGLLKNRDFAFILVGAGGGCALSLAPAVVESAKARGAFTIVVAFLPLPFEGKRRRRASERSVEQLISCADLIVTVDGADLVTTSPPEMTVVDAWTRADEIIAGAVSAVAASLSPHRLDNLDARDITTLLGGGHRGRLAWSHAEGPNAVERAVRDASKASTLAAWPSQNVYIAVRGDATLSLNDIVAAVEPLAAAASTRQIVISPSFDLDQGGSGVEVALLCVKRDKERSNKWFRSPLEQNNPFESD